MSQLVILQRFHNRLVYILRTEEELPCFMQPEPTRRGVSHGSRADRCRWMDTQVGCTLAGEDRTRPVALSVWQVELRRLPACPAAGVCEGCLRAHQPNTPDPTAPLLAAQLLSSARGTVEQCSLQQCCIILRLADPAPATTPASGTT